MNEPIENFLSIDETGYIWYPFIKTICCDKDVSEIHYKLGTDAKGSIGNAGISPVLEYVPKALSTDESADYSVVNVNPYFRFKSIFEHIISSNGSNVISEGSNYEILCDIIMHVLANIDIVCGMNRRDFLIMSLVCELDNGDFGSRARLFNTVEKRALAETLIMFYNTSDSLACLKSIFKMIMADFHIILRDNEEFVFYNTYPFDEKENEKIKFIIKLFLPIGFPYVIHWRYSYGYLGFDDSMKCDEFIL